MKNFKKLLSIFTALLMTVGMGITPIMADSETPATTSTEKGSITIINAQEDITYGLYRLFDAEVSDDTNENGVANSILYIATEDQKNIIESNKDSKDENGKDIVGLNSLFLFAPCDGNSSEDTPNNKYYVTLASGITSDQVTQTLKKYIEQTSIDDKGNTTVSNVFNNLFTEVDQTKIKTETVGSNKIYSGLKPGYYFINSSLGTLVTITSAQPKAVVSDKNLRPSSDQKTFKTVIGVKDASGTARSSTDSAAIGDTITYQLTLNVTNYADNQKVINYIFEDKLGEGLKFKTDTKTETQDGEETETIIGIKNLTIKLTGEAGKTEATTITDTDFEYTAVSDSSFTISVPWMNEDGDPKYTFTNGTGTLTVEYSATVTVQDSLNKLTELTNQASWKYTPGKLIDGGTDPDPDPDPDEGDPDSKTGGEGETETKSYGFSIFSYEGVSGNNGALSGAEYQITADNSDTALKFTLVDDGVYKYDPASGSTSVKSDESGYITVLGLAEGKYNIKEAVAPAGYNKFTGTGETDSSELIAVVNPNKSAENTENSGISLASESEKQEDDDKKDDDVKNDLVTTVLVYLDANGKKSTIAEGDIYYTVNNVNVPHTTGVALPSTGGIGTTIFYVAGSLLVVGAVVLLVTNRRMKASN